MRCIIAGSRGAERADVDRAMAACPFTDEVTEVISGMARGADKFGEDWGTSKRLKILRMPADWNRYGKRAGYLRNVEMAKVADALVAVWDGTSPGTRHMIEIALERGLRVFVWHTAEKRGYW
jgi:hypothetical protein